MDIEASIVERLQNLRQWQMEQQERLLKQQQMQREVLNHEQNRIYQALGSTIHDLNNFIENTENVHAIHEIDATEPIFDEASVLQCSAENSNNVFEMMDKGVSINANALCETYKDEQPKDSDHISAFVDKSKNSVKRYNSGILSQEEELSSDLLMEGIKPLSLNNVVSNRCVTIDDIPLPSPKKDFQTLLEEKLRRESEAISNACTDAKTKPKKPFLKKGQGLSRFKISKNSKESTTIRKQNTSLSSKESIDKSDKRKSTINKDIISKSPNNSVTSGKRQLSLKTVPLPRNKIRNKSEYITSNQQTAYNTSTPSKFVQEMNMSDIDSKTEKELEEQSTPFKIKRRLNAGSENDVVANTRQQNDERTSDTIEAESMSQRSTHIENLKPRIQHQFKHFGIHTRSHISTATIDPCSDTVTVNDMQEEIQKHLKIPNQSQNNKVRIDYLKNKDIALIAALSSESEEGDKESLARDSEADVNHRVRFSEYNEYRTIDLTDAANKSPLRNHLEQQDWNDHSIDSSDLSDVEEKPSLNDEKQMSPLKVMSNDEVTNTSRRSFLQEDITKNSYYYLTKSVNVPEEHSPNYESKSPAEYIYDSNEYTIMEEIIQTSDEEQSVSSSSSLLSDAHQGLNTHKRKEYIVKSESENITIEKIAKMHSNAEEIDFYHSSEDQINRTNCFGPELLKSRLLELEKEIDIFRKESAALLLQRRNLQEEQTILRKEYAEKERNFEENRKRVENQLEEEKKRLTRERIAMENRIRDAQEKARQNKIERQKAQSLQEQLEKLRDELNIRESRWNAAESRYKSELRVLRVEILKLKEEIATLRNIKKTNVRNIKKSTSGQMITKAINKINKRIIVVPSKELPAKLSQDLSDLSDVSTHDNDDNDEDKARNKSMESIVKTININDDVEQIENISVNNKVESKQAGTDSQPKCNKTTDKSIAKKKQYLYESLLKDATSDFLEDQNPVHIKQDMNESTGTQLQNAKNDGTSGRSSDKSHHKSTNENLGCTTACVANTTEISYGSREVNQNPSDKNDIRMQNECWMTLPEKSLNSPCPTSFRHRTSGTNSKDIVKQIQYSDGRIEYWYPNGNVKKVCPDRGITKMIYYNGDVRETNKDGKVKYFYATTRTWHTTTPEGLEILEFPDGQVEKRTSDGTVEVSFPDGAIRITQTDGTEKWSLPDGTVAQTFINGDKILTLPNGQREIHTKEHKRREYPDGTVKLVYTDGIQETRYSSGRKRLKDKDGNLLMDSYDN
ncbi:uncharacterized protein Sas-4 isoform X2 [Anoplolepis gracilipes]|uniref:uncharacterized protein Sas-4 isoform X2 n=1 Tax=Anoplolepis gracilipes TaxID=354296 RepID=UPI003BA0A309